MENLNNPAGRLHALLASYRVHADENVSIASTWAAVFGVGSNEELLRDLAATSELVRQIEESILALQAHQLMETFRAFQASWRSAIWAGEEGMFYTPSSGAAHVDVQALAVLGSLSYSLSAQAPDGSIPANEQLGGLRDALQDAIDSLLEDDELPPHLRALMSRRLYDALWAIDHLEIGGPNAVTEAMERLLAQIIISGPPAKRDGAYGKAVSVASKIWSVFQVGPRAQHAVEAWTKIAGELNPPG